MKTIYFTTKGPSTTPKYKTQAKCLISYYGVTNATCWYEAERDTSEDSYVDALGHHLVEVTSIHKVNILVSWLQELTYPELGHQTYVTDPDTENGFYQG